MKIKYGLPGQEDHEMVFKGAVNVLMREDGFMAGNQTQWDSNLADA